MALDTAIFDMDGLLIDSEPYWQEAGMETLQQFDISLTLEQYHFTTGLRTKEWIDFWFRHFGIDLKFSQQAESQIVQKAIEKIGTYAVAMPGTEHIFSFLKDRNFKVGLATSSPLELVDVVVEKLNLKNQFQAYSSAETLLYGKPNPQVYLNCAELLGATPLECVCFEDSFNGMISAKAARMKCVVIPVKEQASLPKWNAADLRLDSLSQFDQTALSHLS